MINYAYHLSSSVNITDDELEMKRQRALEMKQFLLDNKVSIISSLRAKTYDLVKVI